MRTFSRSIAISKPLTTSVEKIRAAGGTASALECDVALADSVEASFARIDSDQHASRVDILVNNAGIAHIGTVENTSEGDLDRIYSVNVKGIFLCSRAAVRRMLASGGGVILNLASIASLIGLTDRFAYSMSKGAVLTMTRSIAVDYVKRGIRCNCICPARVHTPFVDGYLRATYPGREAKMFKQLSEYQPLGRMGTPEEVAALALYLCSDEASFITGRRIQSTAACSHSDETIRPHNLLEGQPENYRALPRAPSRDLAGGRARAQVHRHRANADLHAGPPALHVHGDDRRLQSRPRLPALRGDESAQPRMAGS